MKTLTIETAVAFSAAGAAAASDLPRQQIDHAIKIGALRAVKSGRRMIILRDDLLTWLRKCAEQGEIPNPTSSVDREKLAELNRKRREEAAQRKAKAAAAA